MSTVQDAVQEAAARRYPLNQLSCVAITWHRQDIAGSHIERLVDADGADALASLDDQEVLLGLDWRLRQSKEPAEVDDEARRSVQIDNPQDLTVGARKRRDSGHGDNLLDLFHRQRAEQAIDDERHQVLAHFRAPTRCLRPLLHNFLVCYYSPPIYAGGLVIFLAPHSSILAAPSVARPSSAARELPGTLPGT